jgi:MSHA biogenesis protein MshO
MRHQSCAGFTLVEAIMVIVITGILAGMVAVFIKAPVDGYVDSVRRAELTDAADTALRRISRDVRTALPNSFRLASVGGSSCVEFLPTLGGGRYRVAPKTDSTALPVGDVLDFAIADTSFDVLAYSNLPDSFAGAVSQHVVIYNLGSDPDNAYALLNNRSKIDTAVASLATKANITMAAKQFPHESPGKRFQVIPNNSLVYSCSGGMIYRSTPAISSVPAACPAAGSILVSNVDCANTSFRYSPVSARNGLLAMTLTLTKSGESVRIYHEVQVSNVP